jgi:DNA-directed RNA polymerase specialized sigma24 family protein
VPSERRAVDQPAHARAAAPMPQPDPLLQPFLRATAVEEARARLGEILEVHAGPVVHAVIRGQLGERTRIVEGQDVEDVRAGAMLRLAAHLWSLRAREAEPILDVRGYAAAVAHNACHAFVRRRFPELSRLRNRLRYVLSRRPELASWESPGRETLCGLASWRGRAAAPESAERLAGMGSRTGRFGRPRRSRFAAGFPDLVLSLLSELAGPCRFDDLAAALAEIEGMPGPVGTIVSDGDAASATANLADPGPTPAESFERRDFLQRLWAEIVLLPRPQRWALLLNLRDAEGGGMIALLPATGVAGTVDIAAALEISRERLAALWNDLPRADEWIAAELDITRRQVINLRKCARERLARRMRRAL